MTSTTIKVSTETRDRLKRQARVAGVSLGTHLDSLADLADREQRFEQLRLARAATAEADARSYEAETGEWETAELSDAH